MSSARSAKASPIPNQHALVDMVTEYVKKTIGDETYNKLTDEKSLPFWKYGGIALLALYLVFGNLAPLISNLVGFLYPAYCSIRALESSTKADDTRWLTYWVVFSAFTLIDTFSGFLLSWLPFYWLAKVCFLMWCFSSADLNGSDVIYHQVIKPFFKQHEKKINSAMYGVDKIMNKVSEETERITENVHTDL